MVTIPVATMQFKAGDQVYVRIYGKTTPMWIPGVIDTVTGPVSFTVQINTSMAIMTGLNYSAVGARRLKQTWEVKRVF